MDVSEFEYLDGDKTDAPAGTRAGALKPWQHFGASDAMQVAKALRKRPTVDETTGTLNPKVLPEADAEYLANLKEIILDVIATPEGKAAILAVLNS
jgi:hypothetical protein